MTWSLNLRIVAYLRRAVRALEGIQGSLDVIAHCVEDDWRNRNSPKMIRKRSEFGALNIDEVNKRYRKEQEAMLVPEEPE
jgi:hypothetical protein